MNTTIPAMTTITEIESDRESTTSVVDIVHLSNGTQISVWNGNPSYFIYDKARGRVEVGAHLIAVEDREDCQIYTFA